MQLSLMDQNKETPDPGTRPSAAEEPDRLFDSVAAKYTIVFMLCTDGSYTILKAQADRPELPRRGTFADIARQFADNAANGPDRAQFLQECNINRIAERIAKEKAYKFEFRVQMKDGTRTWCQMLFRSISKDSILLAIRPHNDDIIRRRVDDRLYKEYASIFLVDLKTDTYRFIYRSPESGFDDVPGGCYSETIREYASRVHPEFREAWLMMADIDTAREFLTHNSRMEYTYPLEGAEKRWRRNVAQVLDCEDGIPTTFIMTFITIDDVNAARLELQNQVEKQKVLLERQQEQLQEALYSAQAASRAKTTFLNNMSHDIRTPLNAILGFNNMALKELGHDNDKVRDCLEKVARSSESLLSIINDILEISRIESGRVSLAEDKGDIMFSFANIEPMMHELARNAGIDLQFSFGHIQDRYVVCDQSHVTRIFTNLISNAIKYSRKGGWAIVKCDQLGRSDSGHGLYRYTFKDNGIGMSEDFQKTLFQRFSRENTSTVSKIQGTGLGLAMCKELVELMGGSISCSSVKDQGSIFTVILPFKLQEGMEFTLPKIETDKKFDFTGMRVLLVEDNELNLEIATAILEDMGIEVTTADDGSIAVEIMKASAANAFDMVLMDIQMPVMDGFEATRQIRELGKGISRIPIIAMTANAFEEDRKAALEAGMDGHIAKPIDIEQLKKTLSEFLL